MTYGDYNRALNVQGASFTGQSQFKSTGANSIVNNGDKSDVYQNTPKVQGFVASDQAVFSTTGTNTVVNNGDHSDVY